MDKICSISERHGLISQIEQMSFPRIISFLIAESEFQSSFKLRMTALRMLQAHDDCRGSNTLLSPASKFYRSVNDALVITMIKNDALIKPNRRPDACKDGKDSSLVFTESESRQDTCQELLWGGYPLKMFKTLDEQMHVRAPPLNPATGSPTQTWVEHAPAPTEMADPYLPEDKKAILAPARPHRTLQEVVENRSKLGDPTPIKKPTTKRARAVKGDIAKSKSAKVKPIMEIDFDDSLPQQHSLQKKDFRMPLSDVAHIEQSKIGKVNTNSQDRKFNESNGGEETAAEDPVQLSTQYHEVNADKEDQILAADRSLEAAPRDIITPGITAPYMPSPLSSIWRPTANSIGQGRSDDPWGGKIVRGSSGPLVDLFTDGTHTKDSPRARPRPTMDQKAPSRGLLGGKNALLKDFRDAAKQLLTLALPRQGPVVFEVAIGRLLINHQVGSAEFKTKPFSLSEWFSAFPIKPGPGRLETRFTPRLTTSFKDIETILNTRLPKARRLFEDDTLQQPVLRTVTYVFSCKSKQGKLVTIELDEDRAYRILGGELLLGSLDFHFPKRSWDASLRLKTSSLRSVDYGRQAESIANNLTTQISLDGTFLSLVTQIDDEELIIQTIVVRRETYHPSKVYADILLRLCEVQDFQACREGHRYEGTIINRESMIEAGRYWWEASLTSTDARTILRVNDELEIGDVAAWDPETIIEKGIVDDLFCLSNDLVTRIDSVGLHNKALKGNSSSRTNKTSVKPSEALPGEGYW